MTDGVQIVILNKNVPKISEGYKTYSIEVKIPEDTIEKEDGSVTNKIVMNIDGFMEDIFPFLLKKAVNENNEENFKLLLEKYAIAWLCKGIGLDAIPDF